MKKGIEIFSLEGKTALVTGATGYLGQAFIQILAEAGAHVLVNGRDATKTNKVTGQLLQQGLSAESAIFDVTNKIEVTNYFNNHNKFLNILVNNAYTGTSGNIETSQGVSYVESYDISVVATHNLLCAALPSLRKAVYKDKEASIINIASMYGLVSPDQRIYETPQGTNPPFYGAAKAALIQWTRYAACEFGKESIRVNAISPGAFPSISVQESSPDFISKLEQKIPMGRIGLPSELKGPLLFLASPASSYLNGENMVVDGGWVCW